MHLLIARKIGMTRRFSEDGTMIPVTVLAAGPCTVTQVKTTARDGYSSVQLGFGEKRHLAKPQERAWQGLGKFAVVREFRVPDTTEYERGQKLDVSVFSVGQKVRVTGTSKGRGFSGVVKRHHFAGGPASHGQKDNLRMPGSIGATFPQHVPKGTRMAGRMGAERVSVKNLEVVETVADKNLILMKGAVPGPRNGFVFLQSV
ncbi:MAG: 50S ribosomal protein L3 [Candidatus Kerfeldbacteria bacterium]|nr:50S ribosomal protein L3 [Candidatus Kerfeldbacteria bacterium]